MLRINKKIFVLLDLLIFIVIQHSNYPQDNYEITGISFAGNKTIETSALENETTLRGTGWFSKNILRNEPVLFNSEIFQNDLVNIIKLYQREGFFFVKVQPDQMLDNENQEVEIKYNITEGPPVIVDTVIIFRNELSDTAGIKIDSLIVEAHRNLYLAGGKRFRDEDLLKDKAQLVNLYMNNGYPHVKADFDLEVDTTKCSVIINWHINSGVLSTFGKSSISGLDYYPEDFIRNKFNYREGEIYNAELLADTQIRLYALGIFYGINFNSVLNTDSPEVVPVNLNLTEAKRLKTSLGLGYGKDEKFRIVLEFNLIGFLNGPGRINFEAKKSAIEQFSFKLGYTHPELLWERTTFRINTFIVKLDEIPYSEDSKGIDIGILRSFSPKFFSSITYSLEFVDLDVSSIAIQSDSSQITDNYNKSSITLVARYTTAIPYASPEKGFNISLSTKYSGFGIDNPYNFLKSILDLRNYNLFAGSFIGGIKLSVGYLESFNDPEFVPVEERYYLGGSNSVRGWERFKLGPADINGKPKGGNSFLEGSLEIRYPAFEKIYGTLFLDYGNVWEPALTYKINELQYAVGIGLRYDTPVGPFRLDLATPVFNENKDIQFWFSIGHAF